MASKKEILDELDEDLRKVRTDLDAAKEWSDIACRIADMLEHQAMTATMMALAGIGYTDVNPLPAKHREECVICKMIKAASKPSDNGIPIIGRKG